MDELLRKLDEKLDKDELGPLKEWLENKLKGMKPKLIKQEYRLDANFDSEDAAGFRKYEQSLFITVNQNLKNPVCSLLTRIVQKSNFFLKKIKQIRFLI